MSDWVNFTEIRARVSLEDVIFRLYKIDTLKRVGNKLTGPCPVHGGDSPTAFRADLDKNVWYCFTKCKKGGNQLDFVAAKENISVRDAALKLQAFFLGNGPDRTSTGPPGSTGIPPTSAPPAPASSASSTTPPPAAPPATKTKPTDELPPQENPILDVKLDLKFDQKAARRPQRHGPPRSPARRHGARRPAAARTALASQRHDRPGPGRGELRPDREERR